MWIHQLPYLFSVPITSQPYGATYFTIAPASMLGRALPSARSDYPPVSLHRSNICRQYRNINLLSIAYDSIVLGLGPDLPWADEPSPGNLRFSTAQILTVLSLLIPAFSLVFRPPPLPIRLLPTAQRSSTNALLHSIASAIRFSPVISSAHHHSTSELLRTLLMSGCF